MSSRILIMIIVVVLLIGAGGIWLAFQGRGKTTQPPTTTSTSTTQQNPTVTTLAPNSIISADPIVESENSKKRFAAVQEKVKTWPAWKENANLSGVFITLTPDLLLNSANEIYVFDSSDEPDNHFTVTIVQSSGNTLRALVPTVDYQGTLKPIKKEYWQINYVEALQLAQANGGKTFMDAHTVTSVEVNLYRTTPNDYLYWVVSYRTSDPNVSQIIKIDAKDKAIVKE